MILSDGTTLIISDIHERVEWIEECIDKIQPTNVLFLGDYFDSYTSTIDSVYRTTNWLKNSMKKDNRVHMMGNHDLSYATLGRFTCAGYNHYRNEWIESSGISWAKMELWLMSEGVIFSHAGISKEWLNHYPEYKRLINPIFGDLLSTVKEDVFDCSDVRGGTDLTSGPLWCDYEEFVPLDNYKQIFGHTTFQRPQQPRIDQKRAPTPLKLYNDQWNTIAMDTDNKHYAILSDGEITIEDNKFLEV